MRGRSIVLLHGGAGTWRAPRERIEKALRDIREAARAGYEALRGGGAVEAVVEAVAYMEETGSFNAGRGSVLDYSGGRSLDAGVMDSRGRTGAVAAVTYTYKPVLLARVVMERSSHVIIGGRGADLLAEKLGLPQMPPPPEEIIEKHRALKEKYARGEYRVFRENKALIEELGLGDTVGAVAYDASTGELAAAVSTGGVWLKLPGRIGDSAVPGAGFYATPGYALAATGIGEYIILSMPGVRLQYMPGQSLPEKLWSLMKWATSRYGEDTMGIIAVGHSGGYAVAYNTRHIMVAAATEAGIEAKLLQKKGRITMLYNSLA